MNDQVVVRFRVADVYKDRFISVYYGDERVSKTEEKGSRTRRDGAGNSEKRQL